MTAASYPAPPDGAHPLAPGARPRDIRAALLPDSREEFDADYQQELAKAKDTGDLVDLFGALEHWRRRAMLEADPERHRRMMRRVEDLRAGREVSSVSGEEIKALIRERLGH